MRTHYTKQEVRELLKYLKSNRFTNHDLCIETIARTGCRTIELSLITEQDIDAERGFILIRAAKDGTDRQVPVDKYFAAYFKEQLRLQGPTMLNLLQVNNFATFGRSLRTHWDKVRLAVFGIGAKRVSLHGLRATYAIAVYESAHDVLEVKALLGHKALASTMAYVEYSKAQQRAPAIRSIFGKN